MANVATNHHGPPKAPPIDDHFDAFLASIGQRFRSLIAGQPDRPTLFSTVHEDLYQVFLNALPPVLRQWYACAACKKFVNRFGGIVQVSIQGAAVPALWDGATAPELYQPAVRALAAAVSQAPIQGVFLTEQAVWGTPRTGQWTHLSIDLSGDLSTDGSDATGNAAGLAKALLFKPSAIATREQVVAEKLQDFQTLSRGLEEFPLKRVQRAHSLLTTGSLYRSEKCISTAKWLLDLHQQLQAVRDPRKKDNLTWLAVATAPPGFCHVRSTMIGTLLEDLSADLPFAQIKARFDAKMHPLQYQRPSAAPSAGNIAQAEKIVAQLRTAGALSRRFARMSDIRPLWVPVPPPPAQGADKADKPGVFAHLLSRAASPVAVDVPPVVMTWDKFRRTVLPGAERIEFLVPASHQSYLGMVTAKDPAAPPIVQWDFPDDRNPVTCYVYVNGSAPQRWNLRPGVYHPVSAVTLSPWAWSAKHSFSHQGENVIFILQDAKDTQYQRGAGFFPEVLKSEYHGIRATLEAYAKDAVVEGKDEAEACGISLHKGATWNLDFRVTSRGETLIYRLDRWD